jgi:NADPH:quinone reductase-like Zn-dependent oxidoreductase
MRAITWNEIGDQPALRDDLPEPTPGAGEVLVRVHASSVNPVDNAIVAGLMKDMVPHEFPITLGRDFAGVVEQVGADVTAVSAGDDVFGFVPAMGPAVHAGSWAESIVVPQAGLTRTPDGVDTATAGAAPLAAVTATLCVDALDLSQGETVLIVGATGGVGSAAAQLAAAAGATVIAPALPEDEQHLRGLGVAEILPRDGDIVAAVRERLPDGVDAIVDLVNYAPGTYDAALKDGGRVSSATGAAGEGPGRTNVMATPSPELLDRIARRLADGTLKVPIQQTYDLAQAPDALQALGTDHTLGKLALRVAVPETPQ